MRGNRKSGEGPATAADQLRRREFLQVLGASFAALGLSGCNFRKPEEKLIPYLDQPEELTPGVASWYASTCPGCSTVCGVLVKNREGRPIKIEGNPEHPISRGGVCARGQATVLDLYDSERLKVPLSGGEPATWEEIDEEVKAKLARIREEGGGIRIVTSTQTSPTVHEAIRRFSEVYPTSRHVTYDSVSSSAILEAHGTTHGERRLPWYRFDKAKVIVAFDADFLGTWISPVEFSKDWSLNRRVREDRKLVSHHLQFESRLTVTGASADLRVPLAPSRQLPALLGLARRIAGSLGWSGGKRLPQAGDGGVDPAVLDGVAEELVGAVRRGIVVSGAEDLATQTLVNLVNHLLGNYGETVNLTQPSLQIQGKAGEVEGLLEEMRGGRVDALILHDANPIYDHPRGREFQEALEKVGLVVSTAGRKDETASLASYVCPDHHALESWGDAHPHMGVYSLFQPTIAPLFDTRALVESLLGWADAPAAAYDQLRSFWRERLFPKQERNAAFDSFWNTALHDGVAVMEGERLPDLPFNEGSVAGIKVPSAKGTGDLFELVTYPSVAIGDGRQANNPWLQELPDPVTKATWGNYASISPGTARALDLVEGRVVEISGGGRKILLPAQVQPGMADGVVAAALGYGRKRAGKIAANWPVRKMFPIDEERLGGADLYPFVGVSEVSVRPTDALEPLAKTQTFDHLRVPLTGARRDLVREVPLEEIEPSHGEEHGEKHGEKQGGGHGGEDLWPGHEYKGHKWGMVIDLARCTGCSACVVACQAENNIPVVGKAEIRKSRDLHWIRIDRYYDGSPDEPQENPRVSFQPMLCQHCDHAPCETVCPVLATVHSSEGLNMQVYNRCVGTRYCANNCPYKVRRFNWFDYARDDVTQNLVLNPDVTVRTRGIMEKCTFCLQRISEAKGRAKSEDRKLQDGEILPACMQSCPTDAIRFGDENDATSEVGKAKEDPRTYRTFEDHGFKPSIYYQAKFRQEMDWEKS